MLFRSGTESSKIQAKILHQIVLCRSEEIIENINNQIKLSGYEKQHLPSGVVITGGGAKLKNIQELISKKTEMESRIGTLQKSIQSQFSNNSGKELKYSVILGLLINGVVNCKKEEPVKIEVPVETPPVKEPVVEETKAPETRPERESNHNSSKLGTFGKIFKDLFTEPGNDPKLED